VTDLAGREIDTASAGRAQRRRPAARRRAGRDKVLAAGLLIIAGATAFRVWTASRTWFYLDDFPILGRSTVDGLDVHTLFVPYIGHLMPAGRISAWLIAQGSPYDYTWVIVQLTALFVLMAVGVLRLLRTLFGSRPAILLLLTYFVFSPWLITSTSWWAAGINHLPALAATAWSLDAVVRHLREPRRRYVVASVTWMLFGVAFAELTLFGYIPMALVALCYFAHGSLLDRVKQLWARHRSMVVSHSIFVVIYLAVYVWRTWTSPSDVPVPWRGYLINMFGTVVPSGFVGGPLRWHQVWSAQFETNPRILFQLAGLAAILGLFALGALTRQRSVRAWSIPVVQVLAIVLLIGQNRALFGAAFILDMRLSTPLALGFMLALGLAFLPVVGAVESAEPREKHWLVDRRAPATAAVAVYVVLSAISAYTYPLLNLPERDPRSFFEHFVESVAEHRQPVDLVDRWSPGYVYSFGPDSAYSVLLSPYGDLTRVPAVVQDEFYVLDDAGRLVHPGLDVVRRAKKTKPAEHCPGYLIDGGGGTIPLDGPVLGFVWRLRMAYTASQTSPGTVSFGGAEQDVTFDSGRHVMEMGASAPETWGEVTVDGLDPGAEVCVTQTLVGTTTAPGS
jgi:hypothetical protein